MRQSGSCQGKKPKHEYHWQGGEQKQPFCGSVDFYLILNQGDDRNDGQDEIHGIVVEKLTGKFGAYIIKGGFCKKADAVAMESETNEIVLIIPV